MKQVSHSEITTYLDCQKKWDLIYRQHQKIDNIHFQFGSMGHKVLETRVIPDELMYPELKDAFEITSWNEYFNQIFRELDEYFKDYEIIARELPVESPELRGVIDVVWRNKTNGRLLITDYKFSTSNKTIMDIAIDEQMYIYAYLYSQQTGESLDNIDIGYISIPKVQFSEPRILKNGTISKDKSQKTTYDMYLNTIKRLNLNISDYEDVLSDLKDKHMLTIVIDSINKDTLIKIITNIAFVIDDMQKGYVLEKFSYMCSKCDFVQYCKYGKPIKTSDTD